MTHHHHRHQRCADGERDGGLGFTEAADASAQDLSDSGTVSFDDIDTNDVVDISFALDNGDIAWSGGTLDPALATRWWRASATSVTDAAAPGQHAVELHGQRRQPGLPRRAGETITFTYTVTATDNDGATATDTVSYHDHRHQRRADGERDGGLGFTEDADASAQDLSDSGTVSFDDIDTNDVVDISFALDNGARSGAAARIDPALATALVAGFSDQRDRRGRARAARRGATRSTTPTWTSSTAGETITFTYTVTATDSEPARPPPTRSRITITGTNDAPTVSATAATASPRMRMRARRT